MKVSTSPRRISRRVAKSVGVLFVLALVVLSYASTSLTAFAHNDRSSRVIKGVSYECTDGSSVVEGSDGTVKCADGSTQLVGVLGAELR